MKLILREVKKKKVAAEWRSSYRQSDGVWNSALSGQKPRLQVYEELIALGKDPDADRIDEIIGNPSWTHSICTNCETLADNVVVIDEVQLCEDCINLAKRMIAIGEPS